MNRLFDLFPSAQNDGINLMWSHRTNSRMLLERALSNSDIQLIEADVFLFEPSEEVVISHGHDEPSNFTLNDFIDIILTSSERKGLKLDFKSHAAAMKSMPLLQSFNNEDRLIEKVAILWLNADILGSAGNKPRILGKDFLEACARFMPHAPLSLSWATPYQSSDPNAIYTTEMVAEMIAITEQLTVPVTFAIRAGYVERSLEPLKVLLNAKETNTLSLWHAASDPVDELYVAGLEQLRNAVDKDKILFDVPAEALSRLRAA
uniref:GP-PDE domain-containing protein n=1 Tax=Plectus sambesii TaxID=2011161 RepID=A0A914W2F9_9BILA